MVKPGEEGYLEDVYLTQTIWVPSRLWPGAGRTGDQGRVAERLWPPAGVTEQLCQTVVETGPLGPAQGSEAVVSTGRSSSRGCGKAGRQAPGRQCVPATEEVGRRLPLGFTGAACPLAMDVFSQRLEDTNELRASYSFVYLLSCLQTGTFITIIICNYKLIIYMYNY